MTETIGSRFDRQTVARARVAVSAIFTIYGLMIGVWLVHIPVLAGRLRLDPAVLGLGLLCIGIGATVSQPVAGWLIGRVGSRLATTALVAAFAVVLPLPIAAWATPVLFIGALLFGATAGAANVAINTQAAEVEAARGKPTMSFFHGLFSVGYFAGAALGGFTIGRGWGNGADAASIGAILVVGILVVSLGLLPSEVTPKDGAARKGPRFALPAAAVLGFAVLALIANTAEGAVGDWSTLYLSTIRHLAEGTAASGLIMFSLAQAACRLAGGPVVARLGEKTIIVGGGLLIAAGMGIVILSPWAFLSPFGFAIVAVGNANIAPVLYGAASRAPGVVPSVGVAAVATAQTLGFLMGPPIIGFVAHVAGLPVALALLMLGGAAIAAGSAVRPWRQLAPA